MNESIHREEKKQKEIFLETEGDQWFLRNHRALSSQKLPEDDDVLCELLEILPEKSDRRPTVLEIGCGEGPRLAWLQQHREVDCFGIEPSEKAVEVAVSRGVKAVQGVADNLPFGDGEFDVVIFGFCLYLCDRADLFRISCEADRVLRDPGFLIIKDFYSPIPRSRVYHHREGIITYKMDYRSLFSWHPDYECITQKVRGHQDGEYTVDPEEWTAVSVLQKAIRR